jgi:hypothetical protein
MCTLVDAVGCLVYFIAEDTSWFQITDAEALKCANCVVTGMNIGPINAASSTEYVVLLNES